MFSKELYKTILIGLGAAVIPVVIKYIIENRHKKRLKNLKALKNKPDNHYYHCIFWTMENFKCRQHIFNNTECGKSCSVTYLETILNLIASAKYSISLCNYHVTLRQITDELIKARERGVLVRIITDTITSKIEHSKTKLLKNKFGFDVRVPPYENSFMHHKYCVIDAEDDDLAKVFFGSLNLTLQGIVANFEFVVITNNFHLVNSYWKEFNLLWDEFGTPG